MTVKIDKSIFSQSRYFIPVLLAMWAGYSVFGILYPDFMMKGVITLIFQTGMDFLSAYAAIKIFLHFRSRKFFALSFVCFSVSFMFAVWGDFYYNLTVGILRYIPPVHLIDPVDFPVLMFLVFQLMAWIYILLAGKIKNTHYFSLLNLPVIIITAIILVVFMDVFPWKAEKFSILTAYHFMCAFVETISFAVVAVCLIFSKKNWLVLLSTGYLTVIASDFLLRFSFLEKTLLGHSFAEILWSLGQLLMLLGLISVKENDKNERWMNNVYAIPVQSSLWSHTVSSAGLAFFIGAYLVFSPDKTILMRSHLSNLPSILILFSIFSILLSYLFSKHLNRPFESLKNDISKYMNYRASKDHENVTLNLTKSKIQEFNEVIHFIGRAFADINEKHAIENELFNVAAQVAHDIRSPLAALDVLTRHLVNIPETQRLVLRSSIASIRDIANNLLNEYHGTKSGAREAMRKGMATVLLLPLIESVLSEKRVQFEGKLFEFSLIAEEAAAFSFAHLDPLDFKRLISNLMNNGLEAMPSGGSISLILKREVDQVVLMVKDTGSGIPPEIMNKLFKSGASFGKPQGSGLGLFYAKQSVEAWRGRMNIHSVLGEGTTVSIALPATLAPEWFIDHLPLRIDQLIIVLDDDQSIHDAWDAKFSFFPKLQVQHFKTPESFFTWLNSIPIEQMQRLVLLSDYEFIGSLQTGIEVIQTAKITPSILVTSHFEDETIVACCEQWQIKLLPKSMVAYLSIHLVESAPPARRSAIFLDDHVGLTRAWQMQALLQNIDLHVYHDPHTLLKEAALFSKDIEVFIDLHCGGGVTGLEVAQALYEQGFRELFLATGEEATALVRPFYIKAVIGKEPPF